LLLLHQCLNSHIMQYGKDEEYVNVKTRKSKKGTAIVKATADSLMGKRDARRLRNDLRSLYAGQEQVQVCWNCGKNEAQLAPGERLRACVKCKEIDRTIPYCSK